MGEAQLESTVAISELKRTAGLEEELPSWVEAGGPYHSQIWKSCKITGMGKGWLETDKVTLLLQNLGCSMQKFNKLLSFFLILHYLPIWFRLDGFIFAGSLQS